MNDWICPRLLRSSLSARLMIVTQWMEISVLSQRRTPCCLPRSCYWNLITICLNSELISLWSFRLSSVLVTVLSSRLESTQSRVSVSSAVNAYPSTVPSDLVIFTFLELTEVNLDSRSSSSRKKESCNVEGTSCLREPNTVLTLALPSSSIPST